MRKVRRSHVERNGRYVDDFAGALLGHMRKHSATEEKNALQIRILHLVPLLFGHPEERLAWIDPGIVDEDVDTPKLLHNGVDGILNLLRIANVTGDRRRLVGQCSRSFLVAGRVPVEHKYVCPFGHEQLGDPLADSGCGAGYNRYFVLQEHGGWSSKNRLISNEERRDPPS